MRIDQQAKTRQNRQNNGSRPKRNRGDGTVELNDSLEIPHRVGVGCGM